MSTFTRRQARNRGLQGGGALGRQRLGPPALELAVDAPHAGGRAAGSRHHGAEAKRKRELRREAEEGGENGGRLPRGWKRKWSPQLISGPIPLASPW